MANLISPSKCNFTVLKIASTFEFTSLRAFPSPPQLNKIFLECLEPTTWLYRYNDLLIRRLKYGCTPFQINGKPVTRFRPTPMNSFVKGCPPTVTGHVQPRSPILKYTDQYEILNLMSCVMRPPSTYLGGAGLAGPMRKLVHHYPLQKV